MLQGTLWHTLPPDQNPCSKAKQHQSKMGNTGRWWSSTPKKTSPLANKWNLSVKVKHSRCWENNTEGQIKTRGVNEDVTDWKSRFYQTNISKINLKSYAMSIQSSTNGISCYGRFLAIAFLPAALRILKRHQILAGRFSSSRLASGQDQNTW